MNISHDGTTVRFETEPEELFLAEKSGAKSNTVRIVDNDEYEMLNTHTPKKIIIQYKEEIFLRTLTNLHFAKLFGKVIVIFSWMQERSTDHHHYIEVYTDPALTHTVTFNENTPLGPHSVPFEQGSHNPGLEQEAESPAETCQAVEEPSIDERFAAITISNGTIALLQSIAHGRTMNMVIKELYEEYICTRAKERGPLHD